MANGEIPNPSTNHFDTCDILVSIHNNGAKSRAAHGTETWFWDTADSIFAYQVNTQMFNMISNLPHAYNRGLKRTKYLVLIKAKCPACLVEGAFVTHDTVTNGQWFQLKDNLSGIKDKIAYGIDNGIDAFYGFSRPKFMIIIEFGSERGSVKLLWGSSPASGVTGYNVYRRTHPNHNYEMIASKVQDTTCIDNSVTGGTIYSYYVKARRSSGQESNCSEIVTCQIPPFSSDCAVATGVNTGRRVVFDPAGNSYLSWTNQEAFWNGISTDYGTSWSNAKEIDYGWQPSVATDSIKKLKICYISTLGVPDSATNDTLTYTIN
ncbi:MAG: N-acetylmuramoyl-L-alanine amidase [bacterium]